MKIAQCSLLAGYQAHAGEIQQAIQQVCNSGWYILGKEVESFEQEFAAFCDSKYAVGVANGTDSLELILRALDLPEGSWVATVPNTAVATVSAIQRAGFEPYFVDISPELLTMSPDALKTALQKESRIKAVIAVHLFGSVCELDSLLTIAGQYRIPLIEDCAQAHGAKYKNKSAGSWGVAGSFSFYPTKNLGAIGDGGAVVTSDPALADRIRALRQYGWKQRYISESVGINSRLDELQAAILRVRLRYLEQGNKRRQQIAEQYKSALKNTPVILPETAANGTHVFHQFVIRLKERDQLREFLSSQGIATALHYLCPINQQPAYKNNFSAGNVPESDRINPQIVSLPMYPELSDTEVAFVCSALRSFFEKRV